MPKLLELFSGTGSVGQVAKALGWKVTSLDINKKSEADIKADIQEWDYENHTEQQYDFIWASPPCTEYSVAKTIGVRNLDLADAIVRRTWEIIEHFKPRLGYIMENPQTGMLKSRPMMEGKSYTDIDYCKYGMPYRKRTRLWNNLHLWKPRPLCKRDCGSILEGTRKHKEVAQRIGRADEEGKFQHRFKQCELYRVPSLLVYEILTAVSPHHQIEGVSQNLTTSEITIEL